MKNAYVCLACDDFWCLDWLRIKSLLCPTCGSDKTEAYNDKPVVDWENGHFEGDMQSLSRD